MKRRDFITFLAIFGKLLLASSSKASSPSRTTAAKMAVLAAV